MEIELIREEPPKAERGRGSVSKYQPWLRAIAEHPGEWFRWPELMNKRTANSVASELRKGRLGAGPGYEAAGRKGVLYARYVGVQP